MQSVRQNLWNAHLPPLLGYSEEVGGSQAKMAAGKMSHFWPLLQLVNHLIFLGRSLNPTPVLSPLQNPFQQTCPSEKEPLRKACKAIRPWFYSYPCFFGRTISLQLLYFLLKFLLPCLKFLPCQSISPQHFLPFVGGITTVLGRSGVVMWQHVTSISGFLIGVCVFKSWNGTITCLNLFWEEPISSPEHRTIFTQPLL